MTADDRRTIEVRVVSLIRQLADDATFDADLTGDDPTPVIARHALDRILLDVLLDQADDA